MQSKYPKNRKQRNVKFMQVLSSDVWELLKKQSIKRGITVQEYIRAIALPEHLDKIRPTTRSEIAVRAWKVRRANQKKRRIKDVDPILSRPLSIPTKENLHQMESTGPFRPIGKEPLIATQ